jgi:hypothetical protein
VTAREDEDGDDVGDGDNNKDSAIMMIAEGPADEAGFLAGRQATRSVPASGR